MFAAETCARKKPEVLPENRVGDFFSVSFSCTGQNPFQTLEPHRETSTTDTTTVSGVVYWLSKDPIGISGGLNLYAFCGNNPVNRIDPFGRFSLPPSRSEQYGDMIEDAFETGNEIRDGQDQNTSNDPWGADFFDEWEAAEDARRDALGNDLPEAADKIGDDYIGDLWDGILGKFWDWFFGVPASCGE